MGGDILLTSQGVSLTEVQEGLKIRREVSALHLPVGLHHSESYPHSGFFGH